MDPPPPPQLGFSHIADSSIYLQCGLFSELSEWELLEKNPSKSTHK